MKQAEKLVEKLNEREAATYTQQSTLLYQALVLAKSPLTTEFKPKSISRIKANLQKEAKQIRTLSSLYEGSKIQPTLEALGYTDVANRAPVPGTEGSVLVDFYSAEQ